MDILLLKIFFKQPPSIMHRPTIPLVQPGLLLLAGFWKENRNPNQKTNEVPTIPYTSPEKAF